MADTEQRVRERATWLALSLIPEVGPSTFHRLVQGLGSAEAVLDASAETLTQVPGISLQIAQAIASFPWRDTLHRELRVIETRGLGLMRFGDEGYPELLAVIHSPPADPLSAGYDETGRSGGGRDCRLSNGQPVRQRGG